MEWMHGGGRDPNGRSLDEEIKIGKEEWTERQRVAQGGRIGMDRGGSPNDYAAWKSAISQGLIGSYIHLSLAFFTIV